VNINLRSVFLCMKHELCQMLNQGSGAIVNVASIHGLVGRGSERDGSSACMASKHGGVGLTKAACIRVCARWHKGQRSVPKLHPGTTHQKPA